MNQSNAPNSKHSIVHTKEREGRLQKLTVLLLALLLLVWTLAMDLMVRALPLSNVPANVRLVSSNQPKLVYRIQVLLPSL